MKIDTGVQENAVIMMDGAIKSMSIEDNANSVMTLIDRLYSRKREAVVRELGANARDAHVISGKADVPYEIYLPSEADPNLVFMDYGPGLSWEDMERYLGRLFSTSKDGENQSIGHYGLGSKSPHTVTDSYVVESRHGGLLIKTMWFRDGAQKPKFMKVSEEAWDGPTGITFRIPIGPKDNREWIKAIQTQTAGFRPRPKVFSLGVEMEEDAIWDDQELFSFGDVKLVRSKILTNFFGSMAVNMGGVLYPAPTNDDALATKIDFRSERDELAIVTVPIGGVSIPPHREALEMTDMTRETINRVVNEANRQFNKEFMVADPAKELAKRPAKEILDYLNGWLEINPEVSLGIASLYRNRVERYVNEVNEEYHKLRVRQKHKVKVVFVVNRTTEYVQVNNDTFRAPKTTIKPMVEQIQHNYKEIEVVYNVKEDRHRVKEMRGVLEKSGMQALEKYVKKQFGLTLRSATPERFVCVKTDGYGMLLNFHVIAGANYHRSSDENRPKNLFLMPPGVEYLAPHRRWVYSVIGGNVEPTAEDLGRDDLMLVDVKLDTSRDYRVLHIEPNQSKVHADDTSAYEQARSEWLAYQQELFEVQYRTVPEAPKVRSPRKAKDEIEAIRGLRMWQTTGNGPSQDDDSDIGYKHGEAFKKISSTAEIFRLRDEETDYPLLAFCYDHPTLESKVYLDQDRTVMVEKDMLQFLMKSMSRIMRQEAYQRGMKGTKTNPQAKLVRISKSTERVAEELRQSMRGAVPGYKEVDLLKAWQTAMARDPAAGHPSMAVDVIYHSKHSLNKFAHWLSTGSTDDIRFGAYGATTRKESDILDSDSHVQTDWLRTGPDAVMEALMYVHMFNMVARCLKENQGRGETTVALGCYNPAHRLWPLFELDAASAFPKETVRRVVMFLRGAIRASLSVRVRQTEISNRGYRSNYSCSDVYEFVDNAMRELSGSDEYFAMAEKAVDTLLKKNEAPFYQELARREDKRMANIADQHLISVRTARQERLEIRANANSIAKATGTPVSVD